jgi:hypothetical protein
VPVDPSATAPCWLGRRRPGSLRVTDGGLRRGFTVRQMQAPGRTPSPAETGRFLVDWELPPAAERSDRDAH